MKMRLVLGTAVFVGAIGSATDNAMAAEQWPTKPIRWICPYVAGGAADIFSRTVGQKLGEDLAQGGQHRRGQGLHALRAWANLACLARLPALPRLPDIVRQFGVTTIKSSPDLLMVVHLVSPDDRYDNVYLRNYAVLNVNFRGSPGFGQAFQDAERLEWGGKMNLDLVDQAEWAVRRGIAAPARRHRGCPRCLHLPARRRDPGRRRRSRHRDRFHCAGGAGVRQAPDRRRGARRRAGRLPPGLPRGDDSVFQSSFSPFKNSGQRPICFNNVGATGLLDPEHRFKF